MIMYRTGSLNDVLIEEVEVEKVTESNVYIKSKWTGKLEASRKRHAFYAYWHTLEDAKDYITNQCNLQIQTATEKIERARAKLNALKNYNLYE